MKRETLEKIRKIIVTLLVLFISILNTWIAFCTLPVHAAESTSSNKKIVQDHFYKYEGDSLYLKFIINDDYYNQHTEWEKTDFNSSSKYAILAYSNSQGNLLLSGLEYIGGNTVYGFKIPYGNTSYSSFLAFQYMNKEDSKYYWIYNNIVTNLPVLYMDVRDNDALVDYFKNGNDEHVVLPGGGGSIDNPDFEDTAYAFTGFAANNKMTASWTGTTERSFLHDQEVEEYVRVNYYFADKEAQDTIKQADAYPDEFATADKTLTIDVSGLKPDDENWFLRYIRITPCYRQAGLGAWGDFYHGESSYVYFNQDGSIDRIDAPYIKGELSSDMERPIIVLHEAANGNPTESDYSYFEFNNAQSDYFFEMKGRWYTTNDFDLYRDKLVWKYKYSTLLKNNLSTWVSVSDNRSSVGRFQFDVLGKSSWDNLLSSYPVDDRNYIGGSYNLFNKITGYSDALETLKMLLKQPYSLFNGYEVYVRYFRYDENGGIQYSKWTHFYNNLADSDGSSGSRLDDLDNMYSENQSDKGLTDDELSDLENGGNSRNDLDAVPKNNYDYSSLENATMNFFDLLKNFGTMLGQFPSMVAAVFGFLPPWLIGLIALAIGAVIVCRFIGR